MRRGTEVLLLGLLAAASLPAQTEFSVATYNVKNYLLESIPGRKAKPEAARLRVRESLLRTRADVVVLQEMGQARALEELALGLKAGGFDYPHRALLQGRDPAIRLAVLSRFPFTRLLRHTNDQFLVEGSRQWVRRGFLEVEIAVNEEYRFTLLAAHLKSRFPVPFARESEIRLREAGILRRKIEALLERDPELNLLVAGDLNDTPDSAAVRTVIGRGQWRLHDARPHEWLFLDGEFVVERPRVNWTFHYPAGGTYSRVDYVLMSRGMKREWRPENSRIVALPFWFEASDHRPLKVSFEASDQ